MISYILLLDFIFITLDLSILKVKTGFRFMENHGTVKIKLNELLEKSGMSKNKLSHKAELQRTQLNNYCNNKITRLDTDVIARICSALDCKIEDLLEYVPDK